MDSTRTIHLLVGMNLAAGVWSWIVDGVTPSWVVYPVLLAVTLVLLRRSVVRASAYLSGLALLFTLMHVPFGREAMSGSCVHPADPNLSCHPVTWLATLVVVPAVTAVTSAAVLARSRRRADPARA